MAPPVHPVYPPTLGARLLDDGTCEFRVWAPKASQVALKLLDPEERLIPMPHGERGYHVLRVEKVPPGTRYFYRIDGNRDRPDPVSRFQPEGVHQASAVVDPHFAWTDQHWAGLPLHQYITYELHIGTFSREGTFDGAIPHLDGLVELGVTAIEIMPVAQFPGGRNWGYDGVHLFAPQNSYGGPDGLRRLVDAAHARGLAVVMDVVYNHIGPEGNYLGEFGYYFTSAHHTPWGDALNFDRQHSDDVRRFFIENALSWIDEYHIDALRLDAIHAICDFSARPFLQELAEAVRLEGERLNRRVYTIAESSLNDARLLRPASLGGCGIDGQWNDDLHHALRTALTTERGGYYSDYQGVAHLAKAYRDAFVLDGSTSEYRGRRHGQPARDVAPERFVVFSQNHDQVGNRLQGDRLTHVVSFEELKLAAAAVLLSPYLPLLFMGEEYAETAPFLYFVSHLDEGLIESVRRGRREEFSHFFQELELPDPQAVSTFERSKLDHDLKREGRHRVLYDFYRELITLRRTEPALAFSDRTRIEAEIVPGSRAIWMIRRATPGDVFMILNFDDAGHMTVPLPAGKWMKRLDSADHCWSGPGCVAPDEVMSEGEATIEFASRNAIVLTRDATA